MIMTTLLIKQVYSDGASEIWSIAEYKDAIYRVFHDFRT
jgi:hypothetical protein